MKILLIIIGFLAAITIIAFLIPSFDQRRKSGSDSATPAATPRRNFKPNWFIIILVIWVACWIWSGRVHSPSVYPVAKDAYDVWVHIGETSKVTLDPNSWSGWIHLPPGAQFIVDTPGDVECLFWSGERVFIKGKDTRWMGGVPNCVFRLRGTKGEASINAQ